MTTTTLWKIRIIVLLSLVLAPVLFLCGVGMVHLWERDWSFITYWPMVGCFLVAYLLGWYWTRRKNFIRPQTQLGPTPDYWTERDKLAWNVVEEHINAIEGITAEQFGNVKLYSDDAQVLALKIAKVYRPNAKDPFRHLSLPEVLTCGELVSRDLTELVERYIPGSHLFSIGDLMLARETVDKVTDWYPKVRGLYWAASALFSPIRTGLQVAATKGGLVPAFQGVQSNIMLWFHTAYVRQLGKYLVELNSGRLKVGAKRYRELMDQHLAPPMEATPTEPNPAPPPVTDNGVSVTDNEPSLTVTPVTVTIVGPVKAGKSSLVNAIFGDQLAGTDVLPLTAGAHRYTLNQANRPKLTLIDTAGFGQDGASAEDVKFAANAAQESDLVLMAVPARSAARKPESEFLDRVRETLAARPHLKMPSILLVLTHIDILSPAREWQPPYDWQHGNRPKEVQIREAIEAARETFGNRVIGIVPVCLAKDKLFNVEEELLPSIATRLGDARGVSFLRAIHAEAASAKTKRAMNQVLNAGGQVLKAWWESTRK